MCGYSIVGIFGARRSYKPTGTLEALGAYVKLMIASAVSLYRELRASSVVGINR